MPNPIFENIFIPLNVIYKKARTIKTSPVERPNFSVNLFEWLQQALIELNITSGGNCDCPPKKYEILDVCKNLDFGMYIITYQPLFTYNNPLTIFPTVSCSTNPTIFPFNLNHSNFGVSFTTEQQVINNIDYTTMYLFMGGDNFNDNDVLNFQITDNKGNYSDPYSITFSDIPICA